MEASNSRPRLPHSTGVPPPSAWPPGTGFATGCISLGEVEVVQISTFEEVWTALEGGIADQGVTFYKPVDVPPEYSILCHYGQNNSRPRAGWVLAIKETGIRPSPSSPSSSTSSSPSPPSSPKSIAGAAEDTLNPFAEVALALKEADEEIINPFAGTTEALTEPPTEVTTEDDEENINPFFQVKLVREEVTTEAADSVESGKTDNTQKSLTDLVSNLLSSPSSSPPALKSPVDFKLIWKSSTWDGKQNGKAWVWLPIAPEGYSVLGYLVTNTEDKPISTEVTCVRTDLTDTLAVDSKFFTTSKEDSESFAIPFSSWSTRPAVRGVSAAGVNVGSFYCGRSDDAEKTLPIACLKNVAFKLDAMPTMEQVGAMQRHFGPTVVFHPTEQYLPSSVAWFFDSGALLYSKDPNTPPIRIKSDGSNLPQGGTNDGAFWIDLPGDGTKDTVKKGNLKTAKVHLHVKPVYGGTCTDLQSWVFYPYNGPSTAKVGVVNIPLGRVGEHVTDWEHYTLRVSNFSGVMEAVYFSQHSKGGWVKTYDLEFSAGNKALVYVAKNGHPCYPHQGLHLQGDESRGVGLRNDTDMSTVLLDSSENFEVFSADYMHHRGDGDAPQEPAWLNYMREWGPTVEYDRKKSLDNFLRFLPSKVRNSLEDVIEKLPNEVMGQSGPTGPREKNMWFGDERS